MHKVKRSIILLLILVVSLAGSTGAQPYLVGDVDGNYKVDANDLKILTYYWLDPGCHAPACEADLDGVPGVSMSDVALLAGDWGRDYSRITLVINEFMTENDRFIQDPNGDYHDWIELYNYGDNTIDIGGMYLTDDVNDANQWYRIPDNCPEKTTIAPSGYLLIWADGELSEEGLHVDFALDAGGDEDVGLIDTDGSTLIDSIVDFPALGGDNSYGRFPNGSGPWSVFLHDTNTPPTPGELNGSGSGINVVINEIMYHPYHSTTGTIEPEDIRAEYIELFNRGTELVNLSGWRITDGVAFSFPNDVTIDVGEYLVVAADVNTFKANYPGVTNVVGGWDGRLSNSGEEIELIDDMRVNVDHVRYADEGDWAVRKLGPVDYFHRGWVWYDEHDGGGKSLELINPAMPNQYGQNWAASLNDGGTPGVENSVADNDIAPMILDARHRPVIPGFTDPVAVKAYILDELKTGITVTLHYRVDGAPPAFTSLTMYDDATHGDSDANDGVYTAQIPAYSDGMIIEFYIEASDAGANSRTWPAPSDVDGTPQQVTNMLYQVDGSFDPYAKWVPGSQPIYFLIMKETEWAELADIGDSDLDGQPGFASEAMSNAQMNATFISVDGVDTKTRYTVGIRNRGNRNRYTPPNNYRVNFRHDDSWKGVTALNLNTKYTHLQLMGSVMFRMAGITAANATIVQVRVNGQNLAATDYGRTYNSYVALENYDSEWPENHVPDDDAGNLYRCTYFDNDVDPRTWADLDYKPNMTEYRKNYPKQTNVAQDDYSDLLNLIDKLNNPAISDAEFLTEVSQVVNLEQWTRYLAADALVGNREGGLTDGNGDDYAMYRGVEDPRFWLLPHDLDTLLGQGDHDYRPDWPIFNYAGLAGLSRLFNQPEFIKLYYNQYEDLIHTVYDLDNVYPLVDRMLDHWVSSSEINGSNGIKEYLAERINSILYGGYPGSGDDPQIPQQFTINCSLPVLDGFHQTDTNVAVLNGTANAIKTSSVLVNGLPADWSVLDGEWSIGESSGTVVKEITLVAESAAKKVLVPTGPVDPNWKSDPAFGDSGWNHGTPIIPGKTGGVGFERGSGYGNYITYDVEAEMYGNNCTCYIRIPFTIDPCDLAGLNFMTLKMRYDDGFVAYINGEKVESVYEPSPLLWNSETANNGSHEAGAGFDEYPINDHIGDLRPGNNILAIHGLNISTTSSDFIISAELVAGIMGQALEGVALNPGINRVIVQTFDGPGGTGSELESGFVDIWYNTGSTNDYPKETTGWSTNLIVRDSYLPGVPVLVRVEVLGEDSTVMRELWDATATLSVSDNPTISLSTDQVNLYNGLGSALVTFTGSGNFTLTVDVEGLQSTAGLTDWSGQTINTASGTLGSSQTWSGIYHITGGDFSIPAGVTLTLNPGTLVLIDGVSSGTSGTDIDVAGSIQSLGTATSPVTFTAYTAGQNWGELHHDNAEPSTFQYTNITQGGHSPPVGHSNTGPTVRASNSTLVFDYASLTDNAGKLMHVTSGSDLTFRHCLFARSVMGPEMSGTALLFEDGWITDMHATDDADGIYVGPQQSGQTCIMSRGVSANIVDDGIDLNGADITIEDFIVRDCNDKGISVYNGETYIDHCLVVETNKNPEDPTVSAVAAKATEGATTIVNVDHTTIVTTRTAGVTDYGIQSHNKYGVSTGTIIWNVTNSIIDATDPVNTQAPYLDSDVHINYSDVYGETWPGVGNINLDPQFVNPVNSDYHLQVGSPCIDTGNPAADPDPDLTITDQGYFWFDQDALNLAAASLTENTVWTSEQGPYRITGDLTVPVGITLTVMPGTTVFFDTGTSIIIEGRLLAEGTEYELIRFTRTPGTGTEWNGLQFVNTMSDNRITYAVIEYGRTMDGMIGLDQSNLLLDHVTLDHTDRRRISTLDSSLIVRNSTFTDIFEFGQAPTGDNICEHIWGAAPASGHFIIENNVFGTITGHNDAVDVDGNIRPAPVIQILDNIFLGGGDDALDLEGDAHIEGNVFMHFHKDQYNTGSGNANVISAGDAHGVGHDYVMVRNVFYDMDHVAQVKSNSFMTFLNNTVVDVDISALYFLRPTSTTDYGRGAYVDGSIFRNTALLFDRFTASTELTANRSIIPSEWHSYGVGNLDVDPIFVDPNADWNLKSMSPAIGAGPWGLDMGAHVPAGAAISGEPYEVTHRTEATLTVGGPGITDYKYCVNDSNGPWSGEFSVDTPIVLNGLANGQSYTVYAIGKNSAGLWQSEDSACASRTWTVDTSYWRLVISEVLARNVDAVDHSGTNPDLIELYYDGPVPLDLGDMSISDNPENPRKFVFPVGTVIEPNDYLVLYADNNPVTPGIHLGFGLDGESEDIYLYDSLFFGGGLLDSVEFGLQLPDLSIGRIGRDGRWTLTRPTFGGANIAHPLGDPAMLKINEWFTNSNMLTENNFIELYNPHAFPVNLDGLFLTDNPVTEPNKHQLAPLSFVPGVGMAVLIADGDPRDGLNHLNFRLSADQEIIGLFDSDLNEIDKVIYGPQTSDVSQGRSPDGSETYAFCDPPTPGVSNIDTVLINEVLAHSPPGDTDWIELHNTTGSTIDLGGWFLSDNSGNRMKYEIAAGTTIESDNYIVLYEDVNFGNPNDPGCHVPFALSENGETVCLSSGLGGVLTGYYKEQQFGASQTGVSFGRYLTSTGRYDFVAMESNTPKLTNSNPKVGPVVINEIMYNPPTGNQDEEYIELHNVTGALVTLYRYDKSTPWRFTDGIDYTFSSGPVVTIHAYGYLILTKDLTAFTLRYGGMPSGVQVLGGYDGRLANDGERLRISMPGDVNSDGERQYICIDDVRYYDKYPWPVEPDGHGKSLSRKVSTDYGNDVANWQAATPSPGVANP